MTSNPPIQPGTKTAEIFARIAQVTGIDQSGIMSPERKRRTSMARFLAIAAMRKANPHWSLCDIAAEVGRSDHGTTLHAMARFRDLYTTDQEFRRQADLIGLNTKNKP